MTRKLLFLLAAPLALVGGVMVGTALQTLAYNGVGCSVSVVAASSPMSVNTSQVVTLKVVDSKNNPVAGETLAFTVVNSSGSAATVAPSSGTTNGSGVASTTLSAGTTNGKTTVAAADSGPVAGGGSSCSGSVQVTIQGGGGGTLGITTGSGTGTGTGSGAGGVTLPNTSAGASGASGVLYLGVGLALMVLLGGAMTLRRSSVRAY